MPNLCNARNGRTVLRQEAKRHHVRCTQRGVVVFFDQQHKLHADGCDIDIGAHGWGPIGARPAAFFKPPDGGADMGLDILHVVDGRLHQNGRTLRHGRRLLNNCGALWRLLERLRLLLGRSGLARRLIGRPRGLGWRSRLCRSARRRGGARAASALVDFCRPLRAGGVRHSGAGFGKVLLRDAQAPRRKADAAADQKDQGNPDQHLAGDAAPGFGTDRNRWSRGVTTRR